MNLYALLQRRVANGNPIRIGLIGAGKFASMFLAQARRLLIDMLGVGRHDVFAGNRAAQQGPARVRQ